MHTMGVCFGERTFEQTVSWTASASYGVRSGLGVCLPFAESRGETTPRPMLGLGTDRGRGRGGRSSALEFPSLIHLWRRSRRGGWFVEQLRVERHFARAVRAVSVWCKGYRDGPLETQRVRLARVLVGHFNYYRRMGNGLRLAEFRYQVTRKCRKWLSRRSRNSTVDWDRREELLRERPVLAAWVTRSAYAA